MPVIVCPGGIDRSVSVAVWTTVDVTIASQQSFPGINKQHLLVVISVVVDTIVVLPVTVTPGIVVKTLLVKYTSDSVVYPSIETVVTVIV